MNTINSTANNNLKENIPSLTVGKYSHMNSIIREKISNLNGLSEKEFLWIGSMLHSFLGNIKVITAISSEITLLISEKILKVGITEFRLLLDLFNSELLSSLNKIRTDIYDIEQISVNINSTLNELNGFNRIIKHLRILGISTKIESARLGNDDKGFTALAENVDKLSNQIQEKISVISKKAHWLISEIVNAITELTKMDENQTLYSSVVFNNTTSTLKNLEKSFQISSSITNEIKSKSDDIHIKINDIVSAIQFHDITRQQFEHISESLAGIYRKFNTKSAETNLTSEDLQVIIDICNLQVSHINSSYKEFCTAVNQITQNLFSVEKKVGEILTLTEGLFRYDDKKENSSLDMVRNGINTIIDELENNSNTDLKLRSSIQTVIGIVHDLTDYVQQIEDIGSEIEIISLNARVKAAHTGSNGSALGILAETIQRLSIETKNQTVITSGVLQNIGKISDRLKITLGENFSKSDLQYKNIREQIQSLTQTENTAEQQIKKVHKIVCDLRNDLNTTASGIKINESSQEIISEVTGIIKEIISYGGVQPASAFIKSRHTEELFRNYTMESERKIHNAFINQNFSDIKPSYKVSDQELGDNVELF